MNLAQKKIALACRILVSQQLDSGPFGNVSIRKFGTNEFWINPNGITFDQLEPEHIVCMNLQGKMVAGNGEPHPGEFIHREIYTLRQDVQAIVHTHSNNTVAISLLGTTIEPYTQLGASLYDDQGLYLGFTGPVRTTDEGHAIAKALSNHSIVIAKNHGLFAVGTSIESALWDMVVADMAAQVHLNAIQLGLEKATLLPWEYLQKSKIEVREKQYHFMWQSYLNKLKLNDGESFYGNKQIGMR